MRRWPVWFAIANAVFIAWTLAAAYQPWVKPTGDVTSVIAQEYLPFALVVAALGTAVVAWYLPEARRRAFLLRHFAVYAVVPILFFVLARNDGPRPAELGIVYVLAFFVWALHALEGLSHVIGELSDRAGAIALAAVLLVPFLALLPYERAVMPTASDEPHYLVVVQSLITDLDVDLRDDYDSGAYRAFYDDVLPDRHIIEVGNAQYPIHDVGLPFVIAIPFAIAGRTGALFFICLIGAALVAQLYRACRDLGVAHRPAFLAVAGASLAHPILTYTTQIYPELIAALAFVTAARLLRPGRATSLAALAGASACLGTLPWLSTRTWLIVVGVGLVVAYCALRPALPPTPARIALRVLAGAGPFALLVLALSWLDYRMFGLFMPSAGYYLIRDQQQVLAFAPQVGALGLLFDEVFGLIPRTPLYLISLLGVGVLWRRSRNAELAALAIGWIVYFLYIADIAYWWADGSPPSRYLLAGIPFFVVLLAAGLERIAGLGRARVVAETLAWIAAAYSLFVAYVYAVLPNIRYDLALDIRASGSTGQLFGFLGRVLRPDPSLLFPSLVQTRATDIVLAAIWAVIALALVMLSFRRSLSSQERVPVT